MKKNLLQVMISNIFYLIIVAGTNFVLPRFTSVETYAAVKEYTLYVTTYADIVTLGYLQGVYLKYGGKNISAISDKEIGASFYTFVFFMLPISCVISVAGLIIHNSVLVVFGAGLLATEIVVYFQLLYQAIGEFKEYGVALNASKILVFIFYITLIFGFPKEMQILFVASAPIACVLVAVYLSIKLNKRIKFADKICVSLSEFVSNVKNGFVLMLGNFVTSFFTTIDRWFVKTLMETIFFAYYSFAVSLENIVNTFMRPITVSMYNYFCKNPRIEDVRRIKDATIIYSFIIIAAAYPAKWILENFIEDYLPAVSIIFPLFAAQGVSAVIKGIYVNKYKADGKQNRYLFQMVGILVLAVVLNALFYFVYPSMEAFAIATLITNVIWFIYCEFKMPKMRCNLRTYIAIIIMLIVYLYTGNKVNSIVGCLIYCIAGLICAIILMHGTFKYIVNNTLVAVKARLKRNGV